MAPAPLPEDEAEITDATGDMLRGVDADEEIDEIDEQPERLRRPLPYTWLQWVILAVVAFVLGFLVILVANTASNGAGPDVPALAAAVLDAAPAP
jgi:predicted small secreted protein